MDPLSAMPKPIMQATSGAMRFMGSSAFGVVFLVLASIVFAFVNRYMSRVEEEVSSKVSGTEGLALSVFLQLLVIVIVAVSMAHFVPSALRRLSSMVGMNLLVSSEAEMTMVLVLAIVFNSGSLAQDIARLGSDIAPGPMM